MRFWELRVDRTVDVLYAKDDATQQIMRNSFLGKSMRDTWNPVELITDEAGDEGDMISYSYNTNSPIFTPRALDILGDLIQDSVEILPIYHEKYHCFFLNIINVVDCLNYPKSELNKWGVILKYDFIDEKVKDQHIFLVHRKDSKNPSLVPIVSDDFKERVEKHGLKGFNFKKAWDSNPSSKKKSIYSEKNPSLRIIAKKDFQAHIQNHVGSIVNIIEDPSRMFTEIDLYCIEPNSNIQANTIITNGNSFFRMAAPSSVDSAYAELMLHLPADWNVSKDTLQDQVRGWPLALMKDFGKNVMRKGFWLGQWFVFPNQSEEDMKHTYAALFGVQTFDFDSKIEPYNSSTNFCGVMIAPPFPGIAEVFKMPYLDEGRVIEGEWPIYFHTLIPLYKEEIHYYFKEGKDRFVEELQKFGIEKMLDLNRKSIF